AHTSTRHQRPHRLGPRPRLHGDELGLQRGRAGRRGVGAGHPPRSRARHHLLRHRRPLRPVPQRAARRQGARRPPGRGGAGQQVRSGPRHGSLPGDGQGHPERATRARAGLLRGQPDAPGGRPPRPLPAAPGRSRGPRRGELGSDERARPGREGPAPGPVRGDGRAPRARLRRAPRRHPPVGDVAVVPGADDRRPALVPGERRGFRPVLPAGPRLPHRGHPAGRPTAEHRLPRADAALRRRRPGDQPAHRRDRAGRRGPPRQHPGAGRAGLVAGPGRHRRAHPGQHPPAAHRGQRASRRPPARPRGHGRPRRRAPGRRHQVL
ncbi:MAG: Oxidoreductase, aldo/keto reductase family, partial [uncultured Pseudonocardia sp.]